MTIFCLFVGLTLYGQNSSSNCKIDTLHLVLAYETANQWYLDDMILKNQEFVLYNSGGINLKDYEKGVFNLPNELTLYQTYKRFAQCNIVIQIDTTKTNGISYPFNTSITKTWSKTNTTFEGKGETMLGQKVEMPPMTFSYKIFDMTFIAVNMGLEQRTIVNMDRLTKLEKETVNITCPVYYIVKIINVKTIE